jgi:hypothetical protein
LKAAAEEMVLAAERDSAKAAAEEKAKALQMAEQTGPAAVEAEVVEAQTDLVVAADQVEAGQKAQ